MAEFFVTEGAVVLEVSAVKFSRLFAKMEWVKKGVLLPIVACPELWTGVWPGRVVAVLAWVGAWPLSTVDPGMSPLFTALQTNPASGLTRH